MRSREKVALISASAIIIAAVITALASPFKSSDIKQQTECGAAVANTQGSVVITGNTRCEKNP